MASCRTVFSSEVDNLQVKDIPSLLWKYLLEIRLCPRHRFSRRQPPPRRESVNVSIHRKRWHAERLGHDHRRGLVTDPSERLQLLEGSRHFSPVLLLDDLGQPANSPGFGRRKTTRVDDLPYLFDRNTSHVTGGRGPPKEDRGDLIDPLVGTLGAQDGSHEKGKGIPVGKGNGRQCVEIIEDLHYSPRLVRPLHWDGYNPG